VLHELTPLLPLSPPCGGKRGKLLNNHSEAPPSLRIREGGQGDGFMENDCDYKYL